MVDNEAGNHVVGVISIRDINRLRKQVGAATPAYLNTQHLVHCCCTAAVLAAAAAGAAGAVAAACCWCRCRRRHCHCIRSMVCC